MTRILAILLLLLPELALAATPGEKLLLAGRIEEAMPVVQAEARMAPEDLDAQERYIDLMANLNLAAVAEANIRVRLDHAPNDPDAHYLLGRVVPSAEQAAAAYTAALELDPNHARSYMGLGAVYRATGQLGDAVEAYRQALSRDPSLGEAWAGMVSALRVQGRPQDALDAARLAITNVPNEAEGYLSVAELAPNDALKTLTLGVQAMPEEPRLHSRLAEVQLITGDGPGAKASAEAAIDIAPSLASGHLSLMFADAMVAGTLDREGYVGMIHARKLEPENPELAVEAYQTLVETYPDCALVWMGRSRAKVVRDPAGATADLRKALELDPDNAEAQAALGLLLLKTGDAKGAMFALDTALASRPQDVSLLVASAKAAGMLEPEAELARLEQAYTVFPSDVRLALIYAQQLTAFGGGVRALDVLSNTARKVPDARLAVAYASIAREVDKQAEGADQLDALAIETANPAFAQAAKALREN